MRVNSFDQAVEALIFGFESGLPIPTVQLPSDDLVVLARHPDRELLLVGAITRDEPRLEIRLPPGWTRDDLEVLLALALPDQPEICCSPAHERVEIPV
jgi:hypothetical protein